MGLPEINIVERTNKTIYIPKSRFTFGNMVSDENTKSLDKMTEQVDDNIHKGMDNFPIEVFNQMIEYNLTRGAIRNAMLMVCMANWGMRFSDLTRVRFGYLFDNEGRFKDSTYFKR